MMSNDEARAMAAEQRREREEPLPEPYDGFNADLLAVGRFLPEGSQAVTALERLMNAALLSSPEAGAKEDVDRNGEPRIYPCDDCGTMRSKAEGGTVFTVCEECWDKHYARLRATDEGGGK